MTAHRKHTTPKNHTDDVPQAVVDRAKAMWDAEWRAEAYVDEGRNLRMRLVADLDAQPLVSSGRIEATGPVAGLATANPIADDIIARPGDVR